MPGELAHFRMTHARLAGLGLLVAADHPQRAEQPVPPPAAGCAGVVVHAEDSTGAHGPSARWRRFRVRGV